MRVAIIGSRKIEHPKKILKLILSNIPRGCSEIVSGGAIGIDSLAAAAAKQLGIHLVEFLPDYEKFGRGASLKRNLQIIEYSDTVLAFWDGVSRGTKYVIDNCNKSGVSLQIILF